MGEEIFVKLRDCFTAGYTLPQYCIDNGIKKPLFVSEKKFELFLWEVYVQFRYDKRMTAQFSFLDAEQAEVHFAASGDIIPSAKISEFSSLKLDDFDAIILLTKENIAVKDKKVIRFTELEQFFIRQVYVDTPLLKFLQRYPKVKLILTNFPSVLDYPGGREFDKTLWKANKLRTALVNKENINSPFDKFGYTREESIDLIFGMSSKLNSNGTTSILDSDSLVNGIRDGKRMTAYQPEHYTNRIYVFGTCVQYGVHAPWNKTLESYLQQMLNEHNLPYRVENEGQAYFTRYQDIFYNLNRLKPDPGDIIFIYISGRPSNNNAIPFLDLKRAFDPPLDYREFYCTNGSHVNELGYKIVAEKYFEFLTENNFFRDVEFNYPLPPPRITVTACLLGSNKAA